MNYKYHVRIDLQRIQSNVLAFEKATSPSFRSATWLLSVGFTPDPRTPAPADAWLADRECLSRLHRTEILAATPAGSRS